MNPAELAALVGKRAVLLDGGLGSLLIAAGLEPGRDPVWWNLEHPERVEAAHRGYVEAGSDVVHANTFGSNPVKLRSAGLGGRCREVNARAVEIARRACGGAALVAGDIGPSGLTLPPVGGASVEELQDGFVEQTEALAEAGADMLSIETMFDVPLWLNGSNPLETR